jgi:acyl dehydratase
VQVGDKLATQTYQVTRWDLIRYAGAALDFNPIHWSDRIAAEVGLPGVLAHGMYTMAIAGRAITTWAGEPGAVVEYGVRFARPVVVPDDDHGTEVEVTGTVRAIDEEGRAEVDLTVTCAGEKVLVQARAVIKVI